MSPNRKGSDVDNDPLRQDIYRDITRRIILYASIIVGVLAALVGLYLLWRGAVIASTVVDLLWELAIVISGGIAASIGIVMLLEGKTKAQQVVMPGADENQALLRWIGRVVQSRSSEREPQTTPPQLLTVEEDPQATAILVGLGSIGSAIRALGRYLLMAILFLAIAWSLAPFAASLAP